MLEKFLKFFRGDAEDSEPVQGSYLSHLLDEIEPHLAEELEECPTHDPLPLLVALTLRKTGGDRFDQTLECPVADAESPSLEPPPPPGAPDEEMGAPPPAPESPPVENQEGDEADLESEQEPEGDDEIDHEDPPESAGEDDRDQVSEDDSEDQSGHDDERQSDSEPDGDDESAGEDDSESADDDEIAHAESTEEDETDEYEEIQPEGLVDDQQSPEPSSTAEDLETDVYDMEASVETETNRVPETGMLEDEAGVDEGAVRVDSEIVLEMGRVFLGMLVENDCLPVELQMSPEEIDRARKLLAGYFLGDDGLERRARQMLRLVEEKFDDGMFSQARILLQLFDADDSTRIENDRNLFYEEMILRFGIQRRHPVGSGIHEQLDHRLETVDEESTDLDELFDWLAETIYVSFDVYGRDSEEVAHWRELADKSERPGAADRLLEVIPSRRWRLLSEFSDPAVDLIEDQLTRDYVADYVTEHVKTCYFILRAVGDTGLEPYLDVFFDWLDEEFDIDGPAMMPELYNETTANERLVDEIFEDLYAEHFEDQIESRRETWTAEQLEDAVDRALGNLADTDLSQIPPGHYDFGRFVLDELFEIEYPTDEFPYKMHRIT